MYIVRFLHQTTTQSFGHYRPICCISSVSYIKPQHSFEWCKRFQVVYRPFPTSNHNIVDLGSITAESCISSVSYIKPQLSWKILLNNSVVYRPFPTSNHNWTIAWNLFVSVVYRPFPTSNHNSESYLYYFKWLYIVRFLHQTTTMQSSSPICLCCISSVSYIKPQLRRYRHQFASCCISSVSYIKPQPSAWQWCEFICCISSVSYIKPQLARARVSYLSVVYRPFPTSNHNNNRSVHYIAGVVYRPFPTSNHNCVP